jgi:hypothetical protein
MNPLLLIAAFGKANVDLDAGSVVLVTTNPDQNRTLNFALDANVRSISTQID